MNFCLPKPALILLLLGSPLVSQLGYAQITITANLVTSGDTIMYRGIDNNPDSMIGPGTTGLNTWDFSSLKNNQLDTLNFVDPATTPYAGKFATATMCLVNEAGYVYFRKSPSGLTVVGSALDFIGNGTLLAVKASPDLTYIPFPSTYLTAYGDTAYFSEVLPAEDVNATSHDSVVIIGSFETLVTFDAYGTMITPFDTLQVIRQRVTEVLDYKVTGKKYLFGQLLYATQLSSEKSTQTHYLWWSDSAGVNYPVVEMEQDPFGNVEAVQFAVSLNVKVEDNLVTTCADSCDASVSILGADSSYSYIWSDPDAQTTNTATGLCDGIYQVTVTDTTGSFVRIQLYVADAPQITASLNGFGATCETCADGGAFIDISGGTAPYSVLWDSAAAFQTTQLAVDLVPGSYTVAVVDSNLCPQEFAVKVGLFQGIKVYPNPADDVITIFTRKDRPMEFQLYDMSGRLVRSLKYADSVTRVGVSSLAEGHYIYRILDQSGNELKTEHFSIVRP